MKDKKALGTQRLPQASNPANQARNSVSWSSLEQQVVRMQKQIAQASQRGDRRAVYSLQQQLIESEAARLLAVRRAAEENQGKHTAGVDGIKSLSPKERLAMASTIHPKYWNYQPPMPVRRVWVPKPGTAERRPLAILPMIDRCKQALVKLALEPEWEAKFEPHSYGFRPGRSTHDAIAAIVAAIERQPMFVFDADIAEAFDHVKQTVVLDRLQTYPALRQVITAWLTAGVMDGDSYSPSDTGIAQGGILTPPTMLQTLGVFFGRREWCERGRIHTKHDTDLLLVNFHPLDEGPNDLPARQPIGFIQSCLDPCSKLVKATQDKRQFALQAHFICDLLGLCFDLHQTFSHPCYSGFKLCFVNKSFGIAIDQPGDPLPQAAHPCLQAA